MAWVAAAIAVGAAVFSYVGSKGNPTGSLLIANFKGLQALHENLTAVNEGLQFLTQSVAMMYAQLGKKIDLLNLEEYRELQNAHLETALGEIAAYRQTIDLGFQDTVSPIEHHEIVGKYFDDAKVLRNALLKSSSNNNFVGALIACYAFRLEIEVLNYLIDLGQKVDNKKYIVGHLIEICNSYKRYLAMALEQNLQGSVVHSMQADVTARNDLLAQFGPAAKNSLPIVGGRYFCGTSTLTTKHYPTKYLDVPVGFGDPKIVEEPAFSYVSYQEFFLVVDEARLGTATTPVSKLSYGAEAVPRGKEYHHPKEITSFLKEFEAAPSKIQIPGYGDDNKFEDLLDVVERYNSFFAEQYFELSARINNWSMIIEATELTLEDINCTLNLVENKDASCFEGSPAELEVENA